MYSSKAAFIACALVVSSSFALGAGREISQTTTDAYVRQLSEETQADREAWRKFVGRRTGTSDEADGDIVVEWVQPANKKEPCRLWAQSLTGTLHWWSDPTNRIYWDGQCRDGYAIGNRS